MYQRGGGLGGWVKQVMGIKEYTCCDEQWVIYGDVGSLYCTPETNITLLLTNWNLSKNFFKKSQKATKQECSQT